jgi:hypothetical protein
MDSLAKSWVNGMSKVKSCERRTVSNFSRYALDLSEQRRNVKKVPNFQRAKLNTYFYLHNSADKSPVLQFPIHESPNHIQLFRYCDCWDMTK